MREQKVEAVERALTILDAFADGSRQLTLGALAERTGLYRSTILRLAASLERFGYLHREDDGQFRLGPSLWRLGVLYQNAFNLADYVRPVLKQLVAETGETAAFYIRDGKRRICLYREHGPHLLRHHIEEGAQLPLDRGAGGHVLIAHTEGAGDAGVRIAHGERDPDISGVAAPVFATSRRFVGAIGITGPSSRLSEPEARRLAAVVADKAAQLSRALGAP